LIDSYRLFHPKGEKYTYWSYINGARSKNIGWRIDYVIVDSRLKIINANIHDDIMGSDHCPISVTIEIT
jgi:exodeoxyribonuclease-3